MIWFIREQLHCSIRRTRYVLTKILIRLIEMINTKDDEFLAFRLHLLASNYEGWKGLSRRIAMDRRNLQ